jgi:hypothetical protein
MASLVWPFWQRYGRDGGLKNAKGVSVTHIAVNQARRAWSGSGTPEEFAPLLLRIPPSQRSFTGLAETDPFFEFKKSPGVFMSPFFEVERSYPQMSEPRACASKVIVYGNSNPARY